MKILKSKFTFPQITSMAELASAAYLLDPTEVVESLGMKFIKQIGNIQCQATICQWFDYDVICFRGTQVAQNLSIPELFDDIAMNPIDLGAGREVYSGFWEPLVELWSSDIAHLEFNQPKRLLTGHSLGGVRSHLAKLYWPTADVISFGAPRGGNLKFWNYAYNGQFVTRVVHEKDFAPAWPPVGMGTQPNQMLWLKDGSFVYTDQRPYSFTELNVADHSITNGYIASLTKLA